MALFYLTIQEKQFEKSKVQFQCLDDQNYIVTSGHCQGQLRIVIFQEMSQADYLHWLAVLILKLGGQRLIFQQVKIYKDQLSRPELGEVQQQVYDYLTQRKSTLINVMKQDLEAYVRVANSLSIDGYLQFAATMVKRWIGDVVAFEVEQLLLKREQAEFINVLQFLVTIQEPVLSTVHVILEDEHNFQMVDDQGEDLKASYLSSLHDGEDLTSISNDDLIMSMLITFIPENIIFHYRGKKTNHSLDMIQAVFDHKVKICSGCDRCLSIKPQTQDVT